MAHPIEEFKVLEDDIILNGGSIRSDMRKAIKGYHKQDYVSFGYYLGEMLNLFKNKENKLADTLFLY